MKKRRRSKSPPFVMIEKAIIKTEAWKRIGNAARTTLIHLRAKRKSNDGDELVSLTYAEMAPFISCHTLTGSFKKLEEAGFIQRDQRGGLYRKKNLFKLIEDRVIIAKSKIEICSTAETALEGSI